MDDPAGRFPSLFSCESADNPLPLRGRPPFYLDGSGFLRQVKKGGEG